MLNSLQPDLTFPLFPGGWTASHNLWNAQLCGSRSYHGQGLFRSYGRFMVMWCYLVRSDGRLLALWRAHHYGFVQEGTFGFYNLKFCMLKGSGSYYVLFYIMGRPLYDHCNHRDNFMWIMMRILVMMLSEPFWNGLMLKTLFYFFNPLSAFFVEPVFLKIFVFDCRYIELNSLGLPGSRQVLGNWFQRSWIPTLEL